VSAVIISDYYSRTTFNVTDAPVNTLELYSWLTSYPTALSRRDA